MCTGRQNVRRRALPTKVTVHDVTELAVFEMAPTREVLPCAGQVQGLHSHVEPLIKVPGSSRFLNFGPCLHVHSAQIKVVIGRVSC